MYRSSVKIGMISTADVHRPTQQVLLRALAACTVVAAGAVARGTAVYRFAATTRLLTATMTSAYALSYQIILMAKQQMELPL